MNRRQFFKRTSAFIAGIVGLGFVKPEDTAVEPEPRSDLSIYCTTYHSYRICAQGRRVWWSNVDDHHSWPESNRIDLPTYDSCSGWIYHEGHLYWIGERDTWEIIYTGGELEFMFAYLGEGFEIERNPAEDRLF